MTSTTFRPGRGRWELFVFDVRRRLAPALRARCLRCGCDHDEVFAALTEKVVGKTDPSPGH
jgi:hypothetical protein